MDAESAALRQAGLTEYEARAYTALLSLDGGVAADIAEAASIPRTRIYDVLDGLVAAGWAEMDGGRPKRFHARPPRRCIAEARRRMDAVIEDALPSLEARHARRDQRFAGNLWLLEGMEAMVDRAVVMLGAARDEAFLGASMLADPPEAVTAALRDALARGVVVRAAAAPDSDAGAMLQGIGIQPAATHLPVQILQVDGKQGLITFFLPRDGLHVRSVWNPNPEMAALMAESFRAIGELSQIQSSK